MGASVWQRSSSAGIILLMGIATNNISGLIAFYGGEIPFKINL